jgi:hypothetical protein
MACFEKAAGTRECHGRGAGFSKASKTKSSVPCDCRRNAQGNFRKVFWLACQAIVRSRLNNIKESCLVVTLMPHRAPHKHRLLVEGLD